MEITPDLVRRLKRLRLGGLLPTLRTAVQDVGVDLSRADVVG